MKHTHPNPGTAQRRNRAAVGTHQTALLEIRDPERRLMLAYVPALHRPAIAALCALDETLAAVIATTREPVVGQMRLTWWHDALCALDERQAVDHPVHEALRSYVVPTGVSGGELAGMIDGWEALLEPGVLDEQAMRLHAEQRGGVLFSVAARILGAAWPAAAQAGAGWALVDLACHVRDRQDGARAAALAATYLPRHAKMRWPAALRPLAMLANLARLDASHDRWRTRRQGSPARLVQMIGGWLVRPLGSSGGPL